MELKSLMTFSTVARLRSFTRAAEYLDIDQTTATKHVQQLEEELGIQLVYRGSRPVQLTVAGSELIGVALPILDDISRLSGWTPSVGTHGALMVATTHEIASNVLPDVVSQFRQQLPHVSLRLYTRRNAEILRSLEDGSVEIGVVPSAVTAKRFEFRSLFSVTRELIVPMGHPLLEEASLSIESLATWPLILPGMQSRTRTMVESAFRRKGLEFEVAVELDDMDLIKTYVAAGIGITICPSLYVGAEDRQRLGVLSLAGLFPVEVAGIVTVKDKPISNAGQTFINYLLVLGEKLQEIHSISAI